MVVVAARFAPLQLQTTVMEYYANSVRGYQRRFGRQRL
jgi:hypothetical protein